MSNKKNPLSAMNNIQTNSGVNLYTSQYKDTTNKTQLKQFYDCLYLHPFTCSQASEILGIPQKSLCRLKRQLQKDGMLWEVELVKCPLTNHYAYTLTTNPALAPKSNQLNLFAYEQC
jgi:hypothetical protein